MNYRGPRRKRERGKWVRRKREREGEQGKWERREREREVKQVFDKIVAENYPNLKKKIDIQV